MWKEGGGFQCGLCVFLTAYFGVCDCLLTDDRNLMNLFQCLRFDASSPAFLCHVISLQAFEPQLKTTGCMVTHYPCRLDGHHHFPVLSSSVEDFEEGPRYTNSHRRFGLIRLHPVCFHSLALMCSYFTINSCLSYCIVSHCQTCYVRYEAVEC